MGGPLGALKRNLEREAMDRIKPLEKIMVLMLEESKKTNKLLMEIKELIK